MAYLRGCIVAFATFVWLFSSVCFQLSPQKFCTRRFIIAFVWPFSTLDFQTCPQITCLWGSISRTVCMCLYFLQCAFSNASSYYLPRRLHSRNGCIFLAFLHCAFWNERSNRLPESIHSHTGGIIWLFSNVRIQMAPQIACLRECTVTMVAFVRLFSTVRFQMRPQIACLRRCKITLAAFDFSPLCGWFTPSPPHLVQKLAYS